jgi:hypothetical protein
MSKAKSSAANGKKPNSAVVPAAENEMMSISAQIIIDSDDQKYKGLYIRLISEWVECCANSKVCAVTVKCCKRKMLSIRMMMISELPLSFTML